MLLSIDKLSDYPRIRTLLVFYSNFVFWFNANVTVLKTHNNAKTYINNKALKNVLVLNQNCDCNLKLNYHKTFEYNTDINGISINTKLAAA